MTAAARFHDYSLGNWLLLWSQAEQRETTVTRPAGYRTWQQLGRHVRRGETGYKILAPITRRIRDEDEATGEERSRRAVVGFRVATVFDYRQTEGKPLPEVAPERLTGDDGADLFEHAAGMIRAEGYTFELGRLAGPNGLTRPGRAAGDGGRAARAGAAGQDHGARAGARADACRGRRVRVSGPGRGGGRVGGVLRVWHRRARHLRLLGGLRGRMGRSHPRPRPGVARIGRTDRCDLPEHHRIHASPDFCRV